MKISEMVAALEKAQATYGDLPLVTYDDGSVKSPYGDVELRIMQPVKLAKHDTIKGWYVFRGYAKPGDIPTHLEIGL